MLKDWLSSCDESTRREFVAEMTRTMLGVSFATLPAWASAAEKGKPEKKASGESPTVSKTGKAKHVIYLRMGGAMTHIDTFDPKPGKPEGGETKAISTQVSGIQIGEHLPQIAKLADKMAFVRSVTTSTADHAGATYLLLTNFRRIASIRHPAMGAFANRMMGARNRPMPDYVVVGLDERHPGAGYLDPRFTPVPIADPDAGLQNTKVPDYLLSGQFDQRMDLISEFSAEFRNKYPQKQVEAYGEFYRQATELLSGKDLEAFDLSKEKDSVRDEFGRNRFGQGCLLARRLIQHDVRWVEATFGGWDMHNDIYNAIGGKAGTLDKAMAMLIRDLESHGLLKETLVVLTSEFGRSPKLNDRGGRDHHPGVFSFVLAGAGIKGGVVHGKSDERGFRPATDGVDTTDFNATIAAAMGLNVKEEIHSKSGRPFRIANEGTPIKPVLS